MEELTKLIAEVFDLAEKGAVHDDYWDRFYEIKEEIASTMEDLHARLEGEREFPLDFTNDL